MGCDKDEKFPSCDGVFIYLPSPAMQWTATQLVGSVVKRERSTSNQSTTTFSGGGVPSSNGRSYIHTHAQLSTGMMKRCSEATQTLSAGGSKQTHKQTHKTGAITIHRAA